MSKTTQAKRSRRAAKAPLSSTPSRARSDAANKSRAESGEGISQVTLKMRTSLHRELARLAFDSDMTMRGYIMNALKSKGLSVTKEDLVDRRRK